MIKVLTKVGTEETYLKTVTVIYDKPTVNVTFNAGGINWCGHYGKQYGDSSKIKKKWNYHIIQ